MNNNNNSNDKNQKSTAPAGNEQGKLQGKEAQATARTPSQGQDKSKDAAPANQSPTKS